MADFRKIKDTESDEIILKLIAKDDSRESGFRLLIRKYQERMYYHIRNLLKTHENTDDVLQNVFIKVIKHVKDFEGKSSLYTWLFRIATNESLNFLETQNRQLSHLKAWRENNHSKYGESQDWDEDQKVNQVEKAIRSLPDKQRLVFHLRYYEEMPYEQISEITGTTTGALKASYHHAVKKIESFILEEV
jgi:RNA polymerase sigma factor (sigma-70 family)